MTSLLIGALYIIKTAIIPFFVGIAISYMSLPLVRVLQQKLSLSLSVLFSTAIIYIILIAIILLIVPFLYARIFEILNSIMNMSLDLSFLKNFDKVLDTMKSQIVAKIPVYIESIVNSTQALISFIFSMIFSPMISVHFLQDIYYEKNSKPKIFHYLSDLFEKFIQTQLFMMLIYFSYYLVLFILLNLKNSITLAFVCGIAYIVPYIGPLFGLILAALTMIIQYGIDYQLLTLIIAFLGISVADILLISPKLIGPKFGLNPLITIFSLLVSASLFGIIGMILAIPLGVMLKDGVKAVYGANLK